MEEIYNQFSGEYNKLFTQNILAYYDQCICEKLQDEELVTFYPSFGVEKNKPCEFLIAGQAVNGWESGFYTGTKLSTNKILSEAIEASNCFCKEHNHSPLDWVNVKWTKALFAEHMKDKAKKLFYDDGNYDYVTYNSFFWNLAYKLVSDYHGFDRDGSEWNWSKNMVWTNLHKIAPPNKNPNDFEIERQLDFSIKLLKKEIEELKPKYCIVLTNEDWWTPFQEKMTNEKLPIDSALTEIVFHEKYLKTQIIVTTRPAVGYGEEHVRQILQLIK